MEDAAKVRAELANALAQVRSARATDPTDAELAEVELDIERSIRELEADAVDERSAGRPRRPASPRPSERGTDASARCASTLQAATANAGSDARGRDEGRPAGRARAPGPFGDPGKAWRPPAVQAPASIPSEPVSRDAVDGDPGAFVLAAAPRGRRNWCRGNAAIHAGNRYSMHEPDFEALAAQDGRLAKYLVRRGACARPTLDWRRSGAAAALTRALLAHDFGVAWRVPRGSLVPAMTGRLNYLAWLAEVLGPRDRATALDVGCGANIIYCILGAVELGWDVTGVDVDDASLRAAGDVLRANPTLRPKIRLRKVAAQPGQLEHLEGQLDRARRRRSERLRVEVSCGGGAEGGGGEPGIERARGGEEGARASSGGASGTAGDGEAGGKRREAPDGCPEDEPLTNVRAESEASSSSMTALETLASDLESSAESHGQTSPLDPTAPPRRGSGILSGAIGLGERFDVTLCNPPFFERMEEAGSNPRTSFQGRAIEMVYPGGERAFVRGMVLDSQTVRDAAAWFSTMVGKKSTLSTTRALLHALGAKAVRTTTLSQGKTMRWAIAWSWRPKRPRSP